MYNGLKKIEIDELKTTDLTIFHLKGSRFGFDGDLCPIAILADSEVEATEIIKQLDWDIYGGYFEVIKKDTEVFDFQLYNLDGDNTSLFKR